MKVKLLADYRGVLTDEQFYEAGTYEIPKQMSKAHADALLAANRANEVKTVRRTRRKTTTKKSAKK